MPDINNIEKNIPSGIRSMFDGFGLKINELMINPRLRAPIKLVRCERFNLIAYPIYLIFKVSKVYTPFHNNLVIFLKESHEHHLG